jgi:hypothetical protein
MGELSRTKRTTVMTKHATSLNWRNLKDQIETQGKKELIALVGDLFDLSPNNRDFLGARYAGASDDAVGAVGRYKKTVSEAICPDLIYNRNARIDFARARKAVSDFRRACDDPGRVLDLMIYYVEVGTRQASSIGIDYESYYTSLESMFSPVIRMLKGKEQKRLAEFLPRLKKVVLSATDAWGYQDSLEDMLEELIESEGHA